MDKRQVIDQIVARLDEELARYTQAARAAQADATDDQSRAENKYDTRGLEASYLAHGQSRQALETAQAREQFAALDRRNLGAGEGIGVGTLVELVDEGERLFYFVGPSVWDRGCPQGLGSVGRDRAIAAGKAVAGEASRGDD